MKRNKNQEQIHHYNTCLQFTKNNDFDSLKNYLLHNCKTINNYNNIQDNNVITYTNKSCVSINNKIFKKLYPNQPDYFIDLRLIYKGVMHKIKQYPYTFYKNDYYRITDIKDNKISMVLEADEDIEIITLPIQDVRQNFRYIYAQTCHGWQGDTIEENYTIDLSYFSIFGDCNWLWTALTRTDNWNKITILYDEKYTNQCIQSIKNEIQYAIHSHVKQDEQAKRFIKDINEYIDVEFVFDKLKNTSCAICNERFDMSGLSSFSIDRLDNDYAHLKTNVQMTCRYCNVIKQ
jgi:hypothetical protein